MTNTPILVIGASGKVGRRVVANLAAMNRATRPVGRRTALPFDWQDRSNWAQHFAGVETAFVAYYPDLAAPQGADDIAALAEIAKAAGLKRMVLLSGRGESGAVRAENVLRNSGLGYTVLRAAFFNQNFSEGLMYPGVMGGVIALPAGMCAEPFVDVGDIAEIAAFALTDDRHHNQLYELTGPRLLTFADAVAEISAASGRTVTYAPISLDDFHAAMAGEIGPDDATLYTELFRELFDGRNESLTDGVQQALGRSPRDFADYCRGVVRSGGWAEAA
ncbi:NmrA family NAD(P)-binding protein [uncultured Devosia sp.]|uniref:NmrA family NAD(P)-binding protein n=1 Tax=uncultured Devosia sp. TaxID=211434 RepID=UPI002614AAA5|nr:NmrA family NAD(P)-binding protein [uncultured Devosia sp.]